MLTIIAIMLITGCGVKSEVDLLDYEIKTVNYQTPNCQPERDACLMVELNYPYFAEGDSLARYLANRIIRNSTLDFMGMGDIEAAVTPELNVAVIELDSTLQRIKREVGTATGWQAKLNTKEIYRNDSVLVLSTESMAYFGGAHGQNNTRYFNFDRRSGRLFPLAEFIDIEKISLSGETFFRNKYVKDEQSYREAGFNFFGEKFMLPANFAYKGDSIILHYNQYEIAPYAAGHFNVAVPLN